MGLEGWQLYWTRQAISHTPYITLILRTLLWRDLIRPPNMIYNVEREEI
jgi:hypothetical protein